jgi:hypothetical protein
MKSLGSRFLATLLVYTVPCVSVFAEMSLTDVNGSLRFGGWSSSRTLDNQSNIGVPSAWFNTKQEISENSKLVIDGWLRKEGSELKPAARGTLREAYLQSTFGDWEFSAGRKLFLWGKADGINPTDNLSPRNFTLLTPDDTDQRLGTYSLSAKVYKGDHSFQFISIPYFVGNTVPIPNQGFPFSTRIQNPSGLQNHFAVKWERSGGNWDWSLSYFQGNDLNPDLGIRKLPRIILNQDTATLIELSPNFESNLTKLSDGYTNQTTASFHRMHVYGGDVSTVVGKYSFRGETAYIHTADPSGKNHFIKNPNWQTVVGGDRTFFEYLNLNIQYIYKRTFFLQDSNLIFDPYERSIARVGQTIANQLDEHLHGASFRISYKWFHETLDAEITIVRYFNRGDSLIRPKLKYAINDTTYWIVGGELYSGPNDASFFGLLRRNSGVFTEFQVYF